MKSLCLIWSVYLLALAFLPCSDNSECKDYNQYVTAGATHSDHEHESDSCTPLCLCSCCGTQSISQVFYHDDHVYSESGLKARSVYSSILFRDYPESIWQPPKSV